MYRAVCVATMVACMFLCSGFFAVDPGLIAGGQAPCETDKLQDKTCNDDLPGCLMSVKRCHDGGLSNDRLCDEGGGAEACKSLVDPDCTGLNRDAKFPSIHICL